MTISPAASRRRRRPMPARSAAGSSPAKSKSSARKSEGFRCGPPLGREAPGADAGTAPSRSSSVSLSSAKRHGRAGSAGQHTEVFLALRPVDNESFYREVDEELRRDQMKTYWERFGKLVIAAIVLVLALIGGFIWWQNQKEVKAGESSETLVAAFEDVAAGRKKAAVPKLDGL